MYITAFNTTDRPVVIDDEGRTLGGQSWGPVLTTADQVKEALAAGALVKVTADASAEDLSPDAKTAIEATEQLETARKSSPEEIAKVADEVGASKTKRAARAADKQEA